MFFLSVWYTSRQEKRERISQTSSEKNISPGKCSFEKCNCIVTKMLTLVKTMWFLLWKDKKKKISFWHIGVFYSGLHLLKVVFFLSRNILEFLYPFIFNSQVQRENNFGRAKKKEKPSCLLATLFTNFSISITFFFYNPVSFKFHRLIIFATATLIGVEICFLAVPVFLWKI